MTTEPTVTVSFPEPLAQELADTLRHEVEHADEHHTTEQTFSFATTRLENALEQTTQHQEPGAWTHPEWEHGTACPDCGCNTFNVTQASDEVYRSEEAELVYVEPLAYREDLHITCQECRLVVYTTDVYSTLHSD